MEPDEIKDGIDTNLEDEEIQYQEPTDTDTDTSAQDDTDTDKVDDDSFDAQARELGYESPMDALRAIRDKDKYIAQLHQDRARLQREYNERSNAQPRQPQQPRKQFDSDTFLENPMEALRQQGYVTRDDVAPYIQSAVNNGIDNFRVNDFIKRTPDYARYAPTMDAILAENPSLMQLPSRADALELVYNFAKARVGSKLATHPVRPANPDKKDRASTAGGGGGKGKPATGKKDRFGLTQKDYETMPLDQIEKIVGEG